MPDKDKAFSGSLLWIWEFYDVACTRSIAHCRIVRALGRVCYINYIKKSHFNWNVYERKATQPKEFSAENCLNGSLVEVTNFHIIPYNFVACLPNPYKLFILSDIWRATNLSFSSSKYFYSHVSAMTYSLSKGDLTLEKGLRSQHGKDVQLHDVLG